MVGGCDRRYVGKFEGGALVCGDEAAGRIGWWGRGSGGEWGDQDGAERCEGRGCKRDGFDGDGG